MGAHRTLVCLAAATTFFGTICLLLVGLLIWREYYVDRAVPAQDSGFYLDANATMIRQTFPGYFRTPEEQAQIESTLGPEWGGLGPTMTPVTNTSRRYEKCYTEMQCSTTTDSPYPTDRYPTVPSYVQNDPQGNVTTPRPLARRRRQVRGGDDCSLDNVPQNQLTFHACCLSRKYNAKPGYLPSDANFKTLLQIAQFPKLGINQYFEVHECCQQESCNMCQCSQSYHTTSAVVVNPPNSGRTEIKLVKVAGCCQCLNVQPS